MNEDLTAYLHNIAYELRNARNQLNHAMGMTRRAALTAIESGWSEAAVARALDVNRMTIRKWAGKR